MHSHISFGYPSFITYAHLPILAVAGLLTALSWTRKWPRWLTAIFGVLALWSFTAFLVMRFGVNINGRGSLPTQAFLPQGTGRVLDLGAGTGRSTLMVLESRPGTKVVSLDLFGESFSQHFGGTKTQDEGKAMLLANLRAAGVADRASIEAADMRSLPFPDNSFDAIISAYAVDHLNRDGIRRTLLESHRVLKPQGQFLIMVIANDPWMRYAFGSLLDHMTNNPQRFWPDQIRAAGFEVQEQGLRPATLYILARRP